MGWDAWFTLAVILAMIYVLARDLVSPAVAIVTAVVALLVTGVVTPAQAFSGFSNPATITVAALYVLARAVEKTGALQPVVNAMLGHSPNPHASLARLLFPVAGASAFLNNTPIVAMLVPQVTEWSERTGVSPSKYLMPLSYAAILGGMVTLIGTSTNLVVSGLLEASGYPPLGMFELTKIGLPLAVVGIVLIVLLAPRLLPERRPARQQAEAGLREFSVQIVVAPGGALDGKEVEAEGLRHLQGVFLVEVKRDGERIAPVGPATALRGGDRLTFVGRVDRVVDLQAMKGLQSTEEPHLLDFDSPSHTFFEAVVGAASPLVGKTLKQMAFRSRYQAAVVAIHRAGELVRAKLGEVRLRAGDTLLLISDAGFRDRWRDRSDFLLVSRLGGTPPAVSRKAGEERFGSGLPEYRDREPACSIDAHPNGRDGVAELPAVRRHEQALSVRRDAKTFQPVPGNPRVGGAGIHKGFEALKAVVAECGDVDRHPERPHGCHDLQAISPRCMSKTTQRGVGRAP